LALFVQVLCFALSGVDENGVIVPDAPLLVENRFIAGWNACGVWAAPGHAQARR
jgi:hypothetical protein